MDLESILQERRDIDYADDILELEPVRQRASLFVLTARIRKIETQEAVFHWFEGEPDVRITKATAGPDAGGTTLTVEDASGIKVGDVLQLSNASGGQLVVEQVLVTAKNGNTLTIVRGYGEHPPFDWSGVGPIQVTNLGNLSKEGDSVGTPWSKQPRDVYNYTFIQRTPIELSKTADAARQRSNPQERVRLQQRAAIEHAWGIEAKLWFGERHLDTSDGTRRMSRGLVNFIQTNVLDAQGSLDKAKMNEFAERVFQYGSARKFLFCSGPALSAINNMIDGQIRFEPGERNYGVATAVYETPHGTFEIVRAHHVLRGDVWGKAMVAVDIDHDGENVIAYRYLRGRDTMLRLNIQNPGDDKIVDEYLTECGLQVGQEKLHGIMLNVA
nr:MAG: hypothetical protein DIU58_14745 [Sphaerobacter thermophilus]